MNPKFSLPQGQDLKLFNTNYKMGFHSPYHTAGYDITIFTCIPVLAIEYNFSGIAIPELFWRYTITVSIKIFVIIQKVHEVMIYRQNSYTLPLK